jgi:hypothetical protein
MADFDPFKIEGAVPAKPAEGEGGGESKGPSLEDLLADEKKKREEAEAKFDKQSAIYEARLEQFGSFLKDSYRDKQAQQSDPPEPAADVTDADFDKSPSAATKSTVRNEMKEALGKVNEYYAGVIGNLADQNFDVQLDALRKERFWEYVGDDVEKFFADNPAAKLTPKAAQTIYKQYVGDAITGGDLLEREAEDRKQREQHDLVTTPEPPTRRARVPADNPTIPAPRVPATPTDTPRLTPAEQEIFQIYRDAGYFESEADWRNWEAKLGIHSREPIPMTLTEKK